MSAWQNSRAPLCFLVGLSLGVWGCAPEGEFGPANGDNGANLGVGVDHEPDPVELAVHDLVNDYRIDAGLPELAFDDTVSALARAHSEDMADGTISLGHAGFDDRAEDVIAEVDDATAVGENVGRVEGADTEDLAAAEMLAYWMASPDHDENMLHEDWDLGGVGVAQASDGQWYFTQVFVGTQ